LSNKKERITSEIIIDISAKLSSDPKSCTIALVSHLHLCRYYWFVKGLLSLLSKKAIMNGKHIKIIFSENYFIDKLIDGYFLNDITDG